MWRAGGGCGALGADVARWGRMWRAGGATPPFTIVFVEGYIKKAV